MLIAARHGLLDALHLWVNPQFAGVGTLDDTLIRAGTNTRMRLLGTRALGSGVVVLSYQPPSADQRAADLRTDAAGQSGQPAVDH